MRLVSTFRLALEPPVKFRPVSHELQIEFPFQVRSAFAARVRLTIIRFMTALTSMIQGRSGIGY